jgi:hypothetical protein
MSKSKAKGTKKKAGKKRDRPTGPSRKTTKQREKKPTGLIFERWAEHITQILREESKLVGELVNQPTLIGDAREALVKGVLERILPSAYEIGTGQVIDSHGNKSNQMDVIIARRDFPALRMPSGYAQYPVEGVIATIEVKSELDSKTLPLALDNCYSMGALRPVVERHGVAAMLNRISERAGRELFRFSDDGELILYNHGDGVWGPAFSPIQQQIETAPRPESYIFGYRGYKSSVPDFGQALLDWLAKKIAEKDAMHLAFVPSAIIGEGCVAMRNQYSAGINNTTKTWPLLLVKKKPDPNPLGTFIVVLLRKIQQSVSVAPNADGLRPSLKAYIENPKEEEVTGIFNMPF